VFEAGGGDVSPHPPPPGSATACTSRRPMCSNMSGTAAGGKNFCQNFQLYIMFCCQTTVALVKLCSCSVFLADVLSSDDSDSSPGVSNARLISNGPDTDCPRTTVSDRCEPRNGPFR
jgi:hypothetical protein